MRTPFDRSLQETNAMPKIQPGEWSVMWSECSERCGCEHNITRGKLAL